MNTFGVILTVGNLASPRGDWRRIARNSERRKPRCIELPAVLLTSDGTVGIGWKSAYTSGRGVPSKFRENAARMLVDMGEYAEQIVANHNAELLGQMAQPQRLSTPLRRISGNWAWCAKIARAGFDLASIPRRSRALSPMAIRGRRETAAAFWIADRADGNPTSTYTMDTRRSAHHDRYFERLRSAFSALQRVVSKSTTIVQLVAFSDPDRQLPRYLRTMTDAGFVEVFLNQKKTYRRIWRVVLTASGTRSSRGPSGRAERSC